MPSGVGCENNKLLLREVPSSRAPQSHMLYSLKYPSHISAYLHTRIIYPCNWISA